MVGLCLDYTDDCAYIVPIMYSVGDTIRPWPGERVSGVIRRIEDDPLDGNFYWCETPTGNWFRIDCEMVKFAMVEHTSLTPSPRSCTVRTSDARKATTAALGSWATP